MKIRLKILLYLLTESPNKHIAWSLILSITSLVTTLCLLAQQL